MKLVTFNRVVFGVFIAEHGGYFTIKGFKTNQETIGETGTFIAVTPTEGRFILDLATGKKFPTAGLRNKLRELIYKEKHNCSDTC